MGKRLIVPGADFSLNGMLLYNGMTLGFIGGVSSYQFTAKESGADSLKTISVSDSKAKVSILDTWSQIKFGSTNPAYLKNVEIHDTSAVLTSFLDAFFHCTELISVDIESDAALTKCSSMFNGCSKLKSFNLGNLDFSDVTDFSSMFLNCAALEVIDLRGKSFAPRNINTFVRGCAALKEIFFGEFNTEYITNFGSLFYGCTSLLYLDLSSFNTNAGTAFNLMFRGCENMASLTIGANFIIGNDANATEMFYLCYGLKDIYALSHLKNAGTITKIKDSISQTNANYRPTNLTIHCSNGSWKWDNSTWVEQ